MHTPSHEARPSSFGGALFIGTTPRFFGSISNRSWTYCRTAMRPAAGEPELIGGNAAVGVAFDDDGASGKGVAALRETGVQERLSPLGQLLPVRPVLEQLRAGQPDSPVRAIA